METGGILSDIIYKTYSSANPDVPHNINYCLYNAVVIVNTETNPGYKLGESGYRVDEEIPKQYVVENETYNVGIQ